jgi:hypothetical protein
MSSVGQPLNFNETDPAAPSGTVNVVFQADAPTAPPTAVVRNISASMPAMTATTPGAVPTPPNDATKVLLGNGTFGSPPAGTLAGDSDVDITSPADGDLLAYSAAAGKWKNRQLAAGSNVTITDDSGTEEVASSGGGGGGSNDDVSYYLSPTTITPPSVGSWTWSNQGNASYSTNDNGALALGTYGSSGSSFGILGKALSSGAFTIIVCAAGNASVQSGIVAYCIALWDSASGKAVYLQCNIGQDLYVAHYPSFTGSPSNAYGNGINFGNAPIWWKIVYDGTNLYFSISIDGQSWDEFYQESVTAYLPVAPTNVGLGIYSSGGSSTKTGHVVFPHFTISYP